MSATTPTGILSYRDLKRMQCERRGVFPDDLNIRVDRALSWLEHAEKERTNGSHDAAFVSYWIAFNALYARVPDSADGSDYSEKSMYRKYFAGINRIDVTRKVYQESKRRFSFDGSSEIINRVLINERIFPRYWDHLHYPGESSIKDWRSSLARSDKRIKKAFEEEDLSEILGILFDRLYELRNQLMHGSAMLNDEQNQPQTKAGSDAMNFLIPLFIEVMMNEDSADEGRWGRVPYLP